MKILRLVLSLIVFSAILLPPMPLGAGRLFNGSTDIASSNAQIGSPIYLVGQTAMSMSGWIYMASVPATQANPFGKGTQGNNTEQYYFDISASGHANLVAAHFFQSEPLNHNVDIWWSTPLTANTWYSLVATWSSVSGVSIFYVNGTQVGFAAASGTIAGSGVGIPNWCFGGFAGTGTPGTCSTKNYAGVVGEVAVWNMELSARQAAQLAHICPVGTFAKHISLPNPVGYWPMYGASGSSIEPDLSGNLLNASLTGSTAANHPPCTP